VLVSGPIKYSKIKHFKELTSGSHLTLPEFTPKKLFSLCDGTEEASSPESGSLFTTSIVLCKQD
jgi:hypothetical protein